MVADVDDLAGSIGEQAERRHPGRGRDLGVAFAHAPEHATRGEDVDLVGVELGEALELVGRIAGAAGHDDEVAGVQVGGPAAGELQALLEADAHDAAQHQVTRAGLGEVGEQLAGAVLADAAGGEGPFGLGGERERAHGDGGAGGRVRGGGHVRSPGRAAMGSGVVRSGAQAASAVVQASSGTGGAKT